MSTKQFIRKASLIVGNDAGDNGIDLSELRFRFYVRRGDSFTPNSADIRIFNPSPDTVARVMQLKPTPEFTRIVLQAGYDGNYGIIFMGSIIQVRHGRESATDTYLDITAADGDSFYNFSVTSMSLAAGSTAQDAVQRILAESAKYGITEGFVPDLSGTKMLRGQVYFGMTRDVLSEIAENFGCQWSIQDGKFYMIPETAYLPGEDVEVNSETGMIGMPEQTQNGINVRVLLNPSIKIGRRIHLNNESIHERRRALGDIRQIRNEEVMNLQNHLNSDGYYYVMVAEHHGDTRGQEWYSELVCLAVDASVMNNPSVVVSEEAAVKHVAPIKRFG